MRASPGFCRRSGSATCAHAGAHKEAAPRTRPGPFESDCQFFLLAGVAELGRHVREGVLELAAEGIHSCDDRDGDAGGDQAVFDRGSASLVTQKTLEYRHVALPRLSAESRRHLMRYGQIGRAHGGTPVTFLYVLCRFL